MISHCAPIGSTLICAASINKRRHNGESLIVTKLSVAVRAETLQIAWYNELGINPKIESFLNFLFGCKVSSGIVIVQFALNFFRIVCNLQGVGLGCRVGERIGLETRLNSVGNDMAFSMLNNAYCFLNAPRTDVQAVRS
jgi:hypothetical protein